MFQPRKFTYGLIAFAAAAVPLLAADSAPGNAGRAIVTVNPSVTFGSWEGWGASLAWWAKVFGDRENLADLIFTTENVTVENQQLPGLGLNIVRYNAGACGWNEIDGWRMIVSKTILPFRQMEGFWLDGKNTDPDSSSWDWNVDANQRSMLLKARDRGANRFELFSNSPEWWMCGNSNPSGGPKGTDDNLPRHNYDAFAIYLATIAAYARDHWGMQFTSIEPFNEPDGTWWVANCKQEGCHFSPAAQAAFLPILRSELDKRGLRSTPISASDESTYDTALRTWNRFDPGIKSLIGRVNVHGYQGLKGNRAGLFEAVEGRRLWNSEYGGTDPTGLDLARALNLDLRLLHPVAWCYWQPFDSGGWGLIAADLTNKSIGKANAKYFVLAQYSRHIRPGMKILDIGEADTVAAYDSGAHTLIIVTLNDGPALTKTFDLSMFASAAGPVTRWITEPEGTSRYEMHRDITLLANSFAEALPRHSIQTFEIDNVAQP